MNHPVDVPTYTPAPQAPPQRPSFWQRIRDRNHSKKRWVRRYTLLECMLWGAAGAAFGENISVFFTAILWPSCSRNVCHCEDQQRQKPLPCCPSDPKWCQIWQHQSVSHLHLPHDSVTYFPISQLFASLESWPLLAAILPLSVLSSCSLALSFLSPTKIDGSANSLVLSSLRFGLFCASASKQVIMRPPELVSRELSTVSIYRTPLYDKSKTILVSERFTDSASRTVSSCQTWLHDTFRWLSCLTINSARCNNLWLVCFLMDCYSRSYLRVRWSGAFSSKWECPILS